MSNQIYIPDLNPSRWYEEGKVPLPQYYHKHFDDYDFEQTQQQNWMQHTEYYQKWQNDDIVPFQFESNFSTISIDLVDCEDNPVLSFNAIQKRANKWIAGMYVYEITISLVGLAEGKYRLRMTLPGGLTMVVNYWHIKPVWPNTILFEYRNSRYHGEVVFETGIMFRFRVEGTIGRLKPGSRDSLYEDQPGNPKVLSSKPTRMFTMALGGPKGFPDWVVDLINLIWTCDDVRADGKPFAKSSETKLELREEENYPMRGIIMDVREGINRGSKIIEPGLDTGKKVVILSPVEGTVFGDVAQGGSSNVIVIQSVE